VDAGPRSDVFTAVLPVFSDTACREARVTRRRGVWTCVLVLGLIVSGAMASLRLRPRTSFAVVNANQVRAGEGFATCTTEAAIRELSEQTHDRIAYIRYVANPANGCGWLVPGETDSVVATPDRNYLQIMQSGHQRVTWASRSAFW
jgi:hypothetical protein